MVLTQFEVRRQVEQIALSDAPENSKARLILQLNRTVLHQNQLLKLERQMVDPVTDRDGARRLDRLIEDFNRLYEDVRCAAYSVLNGAQPGMFAGVR